MKITKQQLRRIIKEEISQLREDKSITVMDAVQQNVDEPSFAEWLGGKLGSGPDPEMVMDAVQQNLNSPEFVDWLYNELGMG